MSHLTETARYVLTFFDGVQTCAQMQQRVNKYH